jgi:hypothetical protein
MPCPSHSARFDRPNNIPYLVKNANCETPPPTHYGVVHSPATSSFLGSNIPFSILVSNTRNLCSSLNVRDRVLYPYNTTRIFVVFLCVTFCNMLSFHAEIC